MMTFSKLKFYTEFDFCLSVLWGVGFSLSLMFGCGSVILSGVWEGIEWGGDFIPMGTKGSERPEAFLVVTTGWEWGIGIECLEVRDAAIHSVFTEPSATKDYLAQNVSGAVDDFISCESLN